ncbi:MAG TPA: hypothetical protein VFJ87_12410 [Rhodanobacteraceae bacterium]|nr:hypothetical protein [Rhodanobacteraceae bacterium]
MTARYVRAPCLNQHVLITPITTVRDARLSYRARGVLARLLSNADGFYMTAEDLAAQGREGRDAIRAAIKELRAAGYLVARCIIDARGQFIGTDVYVYDMPVTNRGDDRGPENPSAGFPPAQMPRLKSSGNIIEEKSSSMQCAGTDAPKIAAAIVRKTRHQRASGIVWYEPDDTLAEVDRIEETYSQAEIDAAIARVPASKEPVPGVVERLITTRRRNTAAEAERAREVAERHHHATAPCEDPETARRKAMQQMAEYGAV